MDMVYLSLLLKDILHITKMVEIDNYIDPDNSAEIIERIKTIPTVGDIKKFIDETFPNWIVTAMDSYSDDYPHLTTNWNKVCEVAKVPQTQIILVDDIRFDDSHKVIKMFAEVLTRSGFVVRNVNDFISCKKCNKALPAKHMWGAFKDRGIQVPYQWNDHCVGCK